MSLHFQDVPDMFSKTLRCSGKVLGQGQRDETWDLIFHLLTMRPYVLAMAGEPTLRAAPATDSSEANCSAIDLVESEADALEALRYVLQTTSIRGGPRKGRWETRSWKSH